MRPKQSSGSRSKPLCRGTKPRLLREAQFLLVWVELVLDPEAVGDDEGLLVQARLEVPHPPGEVVWAGMAMVIGDVLPQPVPELFHGHQIRAVARQRHQRDVQGRRGLPDGLGPVIGRPIPEHDQRLAGELSPQPAQHIDRVLAVGARERPQPHLAFVVEIQPIERDPRGKTRRGGSNPETLAALGPAVAKVRVLMDVRLVEKDNEMLVALRAGQNIPELLDKGLPPLRVSPAQQLLGFLPRQLVAVQGRPDRLATAAATKALAHKQPQPLQGPARRGVGSFSGWGGGRTLAGADRLTKRRCDLRAKGGRPPVRRNASVSGPWAL